jgi:hypothetical protein
MEDIERTTPTTTCKQRQRSVFPLGPSCALMIGKPRSGRANNQAVPLAIVMTGGIAVSATTTEAIAISQCVEGGGVVIRCAGQPVANADTVTCPAPGGTTRLWRVGSAFYTNPDGSAMEIFHSGGDTRYHFL